MDPDLPGLWGYRLVGGNDDQGRPVGGLRNRPSSRPCALWQSFDSGRRGCYRHFFMVVFEKEKQKTQLFMRRIPRYI